MSVTRSLCIILSTATIQLSQYEVFIRSKLLKLRLGLFRLPYISDVNGRHRLFEVRLCVCIVCRAEEDKADRYESRTACQLLAIQLWHHIVYDTYLFKMSPNR